MHIKICNELLLPHLVFTNFHSQIFQPIKSLVCLGGKTTFVPQTRFIIMKLGNLTIGKICYQ